MTMTLERLVTEAELALAREWERTRDPEILNRLHCVRRRLDETNERLYWTHRKGRRVERRRGLRGGGEGGGTERRAR